jgi:hypothetical protein
MLTQIRSAGCISPPAGGNSHGQHLLEPVGGAVAHARNRRVFVPEVTRFRDRGGAFFAPDLARPSRPGDAFPRHPCATLAGAADGSHETPFCDAGKIKIWACLRGGSV